MAKSKIDVEVEINSKTKGITTCNVCGRVFPLIEEDHYIAEDPGKTGIMTAISDEDPHLYDAFDCPHCGCQNVMQERKQMWSPCPCEYGCCEDCECEDEEEEKQDK